MSDEIVPAEAQKDTSRWRAAIFAGLYLLVVSIVITIFLLVYILVLSDLIRPLWAFWLIKSNSTVYPVHDAIYYLLYGAILLVLAALLVTHKVRIESLLDDLQLTISKDAMGYLIVGSILGIVAVIVFYVGQALSNFYLFNAQFFISPWPEKLAMAILFIIPLLVWSTGQVALVQGYFQRVISKQYNETAGLIVAVFCYMFLFGFPNLVLLFRSAGTELFIIFGAMIASSFIKTIVIGLIIAYLFVRSKSLYVPIGFIFLWHLLFYFIDGLIVTTPIETIAMFREYNVYTMTSLVEIPLSLLVLALVLYLGRDSQKGPGGLKSRLYDITDSIRYHDNED